MKNVRFFANVVKTVAAIALVVLSFTGCQKDESAVGAANVQKEQSTLIITKKDSLWNDTIRSFRNDSIIVVINYYKNDTIIDKKNYGAPVSASISREFNKLQTTEARLTNLDFTFGEVSSSTNGKNQVVAKQTIQDGDGQNYTGQTTSGKIFNIYAELVSFKKTNLQNTDLEPGKDEAKLVNTKISWTPVVRIVNAPNLAGQEFELTTNNTEHERYILKNAPELISTDTTMVRRPDVWFTNWDLIIKETWSNDSVAEKKKTVRTNASVEAITLEDKFVSSFDYSYTNDNLAWGAWKAIQSNDSSVSLEEQEGSKLGNASNGYSNDAFDTKYVAKRQRATVLFGGFKWNIPAEEVTLSTTRKVFVEQTSDLDGYSMVKFVNDEIARYNGTNDKTLTESCKLYLKLKEPEIIDYILVDGSDYKTRTENSVKVGLTIKPKYDNGTFGKEIPFKMERAESWTWLKDSVIYENVDFFMQETAEKLELVGDLKKTAKTQKDNGGVFSFNEYEGDFRAKVTSNGMTKYTTWHAIWSEDFSFTYTDENGKTFSHTFNKSDYNVKAQNASLKKNESKSSVTSEVYDYSVDGIFAIDNVTRSAYGYGRFQKTIDEKVIKEYWSTEKSAWTEYGINSYYKVKIIREYNTGKKTEQEFTYKHIGTKSGSSFELTAQSTEHVVGAPQENVSLKRDQNEKISDKVTFNYDLMNLDYKCQVNFDGAPEKTDIFHFEVLSGVSFSFVDVNGETQVISFDDFNRSFTNNVKSLTVKSENESETQYNYINEGAFTYGGTTANVNCLGLIHVAKSQETPDFDIEVGSIYASVCRPSNRSASDITAYTYLLVSKDGKKCLPLGIYHDVVTVGEITDMQEGFNSACYVKDQNKVVATHAYSDSGLGMMIWCGADGNPVDAASHLVLQGAGFNDRGNDWVNHTGKYAPHATKKNGVTVVTFEGTNVSYTFRGWNVQ